MMTNLVYDRTSEDVAEVRRLLAKLDPETGDGLTAAEQAKWDAGLKGAYNFTDLNRVESAVKTLAAALTSAGYPVAVTPVLKGGSRLPSGYTELESIEGTGTQYIDTGVSPTKSTKFQFAITMKALTGDVIIGDMTNDNNDYRIFNYQGAVYWDMSSSRLIAAANSLPVGERAEFEVGNNYVKKNGIMLVSGGALTALSIPQTIHVFGTGQGTCKAVIEYLTIWESDTRVRDFIPCKNPSGTVGMYDLVGGEFYGNSGTGAFTAGAEVSKSEDREWQEGDVLYRSQWTTYLDNVQQLRDAYYTLAETGELPKPEDKLGYVGANTIEKVLADIDLLIDCMKSSYRRCGAFRAGNHAAHLPLKGSV